jgi:tetratricopeptide (TPR) repeat protein
MAPVGSRTITVAAALLWASLSWAAPSDITLGEIALLPEYCPYTRFFDGGLEGRANSPTQQAYAAKIGKNFWALHHYCWGLVNAHRASRAGLPASERSYLLQNAIDEIYYVLNNNSDPQFVLLPELYLRAGRFHLELGRPAQAIEHFEKSKQANAQYWPAYLDLARVNARLGRNAEALEALDAGLAQVPNQPDLLKERRRLAAARTSGPKRDVPSAPSDPASQARRR